MFLLLFLLAAAPKSKDDTADAPVIQQRLRACGHSEGAVRFPWDTKEGPKTALAYACTQKNQTTVLVYAPLPSGQYGLVCDTSPFPGVAHEMTGHVVLGKHLLHLQSIVFSPDEERIVEVVLQPRWGKCGVLGTSDIRHPDDGPLWREPKGGVEVDEEGFDVWQTPQRLEFRGEAAVGPKRRAAMAMRGKRHAPKLGSKGELAFDVTDIALEAVAPIPTSVTKTSASFARSLVRGWRVRFKGETLRVTAGEHVISYDSKVQRWQIGPQLFGAGLLAKATGALMNEGVALFEPPIDLSELVLSAEVESLVVFKDAEEWPLFEAHEDFGEKN